MSGFLPYVRARVFDCFFMGVRAHQRMKRQPSHGNRLWPAFGAPAGTVALTIDDGPHPEWTPQMLDLLAQHNIRATFFLIGGNVAAHPRLARRICEAGHVIGNHSMSHPQPFSALPPHRLYVEIRETQQQIEDATGVSPVLFRAPGGGWSPRVLRIAASLGLSTVDWTVNPSDWKRPGTGRIARSLSRSRSGHVLLCHDGGGDRSQTVEALALVVPALAQRGLHFACLSA